MAERVRRGGWPGPRKPSWSFRPTSSAEDVVAAYIKARGLNAERDRSRAINALLELATPAQHSHDWHCCEAGEDECCEHCFTAEPGAILAAHPDARTATPTDPEEPQP